MDEHPEDPLAYVGFVLRGEGYDVSQPHERVMLVEGDFLNPERIALKAAALADDGPAGVWAIGKEGDWMLAAWSRPDLVTVTHRGAGPQRWRHRRLPATLAPDAPPFLQGGPTSHEIVSKPKFRSTDEAVSVIAGLGLDDPAPPGWEPPPPPPKPIASPPKAARAPRAPRASTAKPAKPEPTVAVCPRCFMAIPATGICDNCG